MDNIKEITMDDLTMESFWDAFLHEDKKLKNLWGLVQAFRFLYLEYHAF